MELRALKSGSPAWLFLFVVGILVYTNTRWLVPLHEQCHVFVVYLTGGHVTALTFDHIWWSGGAPDLIRFFGYGGEVVLYAVLSVLSRRLSAFWLGVIFPIPFMAYRSYDFSKLGLPADYALVTLWLFAIIGCVAIIYFRFFASVPDEQKVSPREVILHEPLK